MAIMEEFFELRKVEGVEVKVVTRPMTLEEARQVYPYRPFSKYAESRFGGNNLTDDFALLLGGNAVRCLMCQAPTKVEYLRDKVCPDCDGRSQLKGKDPHEG